MKINVYLYQITKSIIQKRRLLDDVLKLYVEKEFKRKNELASINGNKSKLEKIVAEIEEDRKKKGGNIESYLNELTENKNPSNQIERKNKTPLNPEVTVKVGETICPRYGGYCPVTHGRSGRDRTGNCVDRLGK